MKTRLNKKYRKAVFIVVYSLTKKEPVYLLLKRKLHWKGWEFPKGAIEKNESSIEAVRRELFEETGLYPLKIKKFNYKGRYKYKKILKDRPNFIGQTFSLFAAEVKIKKIKIDKKEHSGFKWLSFSNAYKTLTWPNQKKSLKIVNSWLSKNGKK
ncbi:MAG: diadenosine 5'5'''-P1,P4-tetraphosphate pyrophosphohydrolase [Candidatus Pacearchaeota archaeon]|nr:MAG: diadenosine 5'5'''-P1,P4-tetraphosphate pyrophosphohydrolase [Candidatus Pacearchaeota archaeon]